MGCLAPESELGVARNSQDMLYPELLFFPQYMNESFARPKSVNP